MRIDKQNESALLIALTEAIQGASVHSYGLIAFPERWEEQVKQTLDEDFRRSLYKHLDGGGLNSLARDFIASKMHEEEIPFPSKTEQNEIGTRSLISYSQFSDPLSVARRIINKLKSAPVNYEVCTFALLHLSQRIPRDIDIKISNRLRIVGEAAVPSEFKTFDHNPQLDHHLRTHNARSDAFRHIPEEKLYFFYKTSGLITDRNRPKCFADMYDDIRAFYGAAIAFDLLGYHPFFRDDLEIPVFANSTIGGEYKLEIVEEIEPDLHDASQSYITEKVQKGLIEGKSLEEILTPVIRLFGSPEFQRLRTSAIWLLRSFLSERGMDRILDATIAIEVLLGDRDASDRIGLSKLMANRCAYALGKSASERKDLYDFFTNFYRLRSEIVHSGRLKLEEGEEKSVSKGVDLASQILRHEVGMH